MLLTMLCAALAAVIVAAVVLVALCGWAGKVPRSQRIALAMLAAGVLWAGPTRLRAGAIGFGDFLMLAGVLLYVLAVYGPQLRDHLDQMDGDRDGRLAFLELRPNDLVTQMSAQRRRTRPPLSLH